MRLTLACLPLVLLACGDDPAPDRCIDAPTFTSNVFPLIQDQCLECHSANKVGPDRKGAPELYNYDTYESAQPAFAAMVSAITSGRMPPPDSARIATTTEERVTVGRWEDCGYPKSGTLTTQ